MSPRRSLPALPALALAVLGLAAPAAAGARCPGADRPLGRAAIRAAARTTLCLVNAQRHRHGLRSLRRQRLLARPARGHSVDMVRRRYFAHGDIGSRLRRYMAGARAAKVGENIAWSSRPATPRAIVRMWMASPPHRANILDPAYREIGVGIAAGTPAGLAGGTWTTDFGFRR